MPDAPRPLSWAMGRPPCACDEVNARKVARYTDRANYRQKSADGTDISLGNPDARICTDPWFLGQEASR